MSFAESFRFPLSKLYRLLPLGIAFGSGLLTGLAPAPLNAFPLAWITLAPLWVLLCRRSDSPGSSSASVVVLALSWGIGYHGLALSWITGLHPLTWMGIPWMASLAIALFCWIFITLCGAVQVVSWAWLVQWLEQRRVQGLGLRGSGLLSALRRVLMGTAIWCGLDWVWSLGSFYWTALSYTQSPGNLAILHLGQLSGDSTITAAIVAVNGLLAEAWIRYGANDWRDVGAAMDSTRNLSGLSGRRTLQSVVLFLIAIGLLVSLHLIGFALYSRPLAESEKAALKVGIVQGNIPTRIKLFSEGLRRAEENYTQGYEALVAQGVEAVLTPEGALPYLWNARDRKGSLFYQAVLQHRVIAWLGTFTMEQGGIARTLLTLTGDGASFSHYNKVKLVPLGEYIPLQELWGGLIRILSPVDENGVAGRLDQRLDTPVGRAIASICYDSAFAEIVRAQAAAGGQFILTASNLDPYSEVLMAQHQAQDILRAIETNRWAVRATNTGYSSIVDPHGRLLWRSQPHTYAIHADRIYRRQTQTLYVRWGDWLTLLLLGLAAIASLPVLRRQ
jgi:apolipoprotein N-acyltransferase